MNTFHWNVLSPIEIFKNKKGYFIRFLKIFPISVKMSLPCFNQIYQLLWFALPNTQCEYCLWAGFFYFQV